MFARCLHYLMILALCLTTPAWASDGGGGGDGMGGMSGGGTAGGLNSGTTKAVVKTLKRGFGRCQSVKPVFRFDCYRQTYHLAANQMNGIPAYADAQEALIAVERKLDQIMARDADPNTRPIRKGLQTLRPIKPAAVPQATADLGKALEKAETTLLRSSDRGGVHYARIAEAVGSNKVLLRSLLDLLAPGLRMITGLA